MLSVLYFAIELIVNVEESSSKNFYINFLNKILKNLVSWILLNFYEMDGEPFGEKSMIVIFKNYPILESFYNSFLFLKIFFNGFINMLSWFAIVFKFMSYNGSFWNSMSAIVYFYLSKHVDIFDYWLWFFIFWYTTGFQYLINNNEFRLTMYNFTEKLFNIRMYFTRITNVHTFSRYGFFFEYWEEEFFLFIEWPIEYLFLFMNGVFDSFVWQYSSGNHKQSYFNIFMKSVRANSNWYWEWRH